MPRDRPHGFQYPGIERPSSDPLARFPYTGRDLLYHGRTPGRVNRIIGGCDGRRWFLTGLLFLTLSFVLPVQAGAWWNEQWQYRKKITFDTTPTGADIKENLAFQDDNEFVASFNRENLMIEVLPKTDPGGQTLAFLQRFPDQSGIIYCFSRKQVDELASILAINASLSLFYHLASGQIRQYIPRPAGFFDQAIEQALFYLRGIFKGEAHPFEKTPEKKLNPLQQVTYFGLLNVLLPLQGLTGMLMWGAQRWPDLAEKLGGLTFLAPLHTIVAWLFAAFIVMHVYLTTTGHKPLTDIQAMITGWEDVEMHENHETIPGEPEPAVEIVAPVEQPGAVINLSESDAEVA